MDSNAEGARRSQVPLALIECLDRQGQVRQSALVQHWPFRIGRSFEADMMLDDPHLAGLHAELDVVDGAVRMTLGQTVNGAWVDGRKLQSGESIAVPPSRTWRMGGSDWRVRLASDSLAPELPLTGGQLALPADAPPLPAWRHLLPLLLVSVLAHLFERWLDNNPGTAMNTYLSAALGTAGMTMGWALFWALGNKLFQGRLDFKVHLRFALIYSLVWTVLDAVLPPLAYAMDWPVLSRISYLAAAGMICALVWAHLVWIMPNHRRGLLAGMVSLYLTGAGLHLWINQQRSGQYFSERYVTALPPSSWRLVGTQPVSALLDDARGMKATLDAQAAEEGDEDAASDE
jgi:hypothetical protein